MGDPGAVVVDGLRRDGVGRGDPVALAFAPGVGLGLATSVGRRLSVGTDSGDPVAAVRHVEDELRPRWVLWSTDTALALVRAGLRVATCWDLAATHRLLFGGWRADPGWAWARLRGLATDTMPVTVNTYVPV